MTKGIRLKLFGTRGDELKFIAFQDGFNRRAFNSPTLPEFMKDAEEDFSELWADAWKRGAAKRLTAINEYKERFGA